MLPHLIRAVCAYVPSNWPPFTFSFARVTGLPQNTRVGDCGPFSVKFIELHSHGLLLPMHEIRTTVVDKFCLCYVIDLYEEFVCKLNCYGFRFLSTMPFMLRSCFVLFHVIYVLNLLYFLFVTLFG